LNYGNSLLSITYIGNDKAQRREFYQQFYSIR